MGKHETADSFQLMLPSIESNSFCVELQRESRKPRGFASYKALAKTEALANLPMDAYLPW